MVRMYHGRPSIVKYIKRSAVSHDLFECVRIAMVIYQVTNVPKFERV